MIGFYNYTVILTYLGTVSGFTGITYVLSGDIRAALICLMISGFCDMFDGKIASTRKRTPQEKRFGIQIDSLSDLICFGLLPGIIGFQCSPKGALHILISSMFLLCALIRLAWFNVDEEERQVKEDCIRKAYLGLPVTSTALLMPLFMGCAKLMGLPLGPVSSALLISLGTAFLLPFHLKKPGLKGIASMIALGISCLAIVLMGVWT